MFIIDVKSLGLASNLLSQHLLPYRSSTLPPGMKSTHLSDRTTQQKNISASSHDLMANRLTNSKTSSRYQRCSQEYSDPTNFQITKQRLFLKPHGSQWCNAPSRRKHCRHKCFKSVWSGACGNYLRVSGSNGMLFYTMLMTMQNTKPATRLRAKLHQISPFMAGPGRLSFFNF